MRWEWDRSVVYGLLSALRSIALGPVSAVLVITFLSKETQGFYYYFRSLLGLAAAAEFGMTVMVVPMMSHEWTRLTYTPGLSPQGRPEDLGRWVGMARSIFGFYLMVGPLVGLVLYWLADRSLPTASADWRLAWFYTCVLAWLEFSLRPLISVLEGCQQVAPAFRIRLWQGIFASMALWYVLVQGGGLWCLPASLLVTSLCGLIPLLGYPEIYRGFLSSPVASTLRWKEEVWPMQWRLGLASLSAITASSFIVPIVFHLCGPEMAGRFGLSLVLGQIVATLTAIWVQTKSARLARLVALGESGELHRTLYLTIFVGLLTGLGASLAAELGIVGLRLLHLKYYARMLPELHSAILLLSAVVGTFHSPLAFYLRAHRFEPYLGTSLLSAGSTLFFTWALTARFGILGACWAQLLANLIILPPTFLIWNRFRYARYKTAPAAEAVGVHQE